MDNVRQLALIYSGVLVINFALSAVLWFKHRTGLHRSLFLVWAISILFLVVQAYPTTDPFMVALAFLPTYFVSRALSELIGGIADFTPRRRLHWIVAGAGTACAILIHLLGGPFWAIALPVSVAVCLPVLETPLRAVLSKTSRLSLSGKAAAISCLALGTHHLDYPFLRDKPQFATLALTVALLVVFAISITAPAAVLERVTQERTKIDELNQFQRRFFANVTHELRTPLTMILSPLESILTGDFGPLTPMQRSFLEANWRNGVRLLRLINDLLDLAKLEEGFLWLRPQKVDLPALLDAVASYARPLAARKDLTLELVVKSPPTDLHVDAEKIERVLVNLISNALKFTEKGGVTLVVETKEGAVEISVVDTGIGIPPENLETIFDRFNQGDASLNRRYGGTGIGLTYAQEIVELHGGKITVQSTPGQGSRFTVHLREGADAIPEKVRDRRVSTAGQDTPKRQDDQQPVEWAQRLQAQKDYRFAEISDVTDRRLVPRGSAPALGARVLLVEDNIDILELVNLQFRDKYNVYVAQNGREGLELAQKERPDLIVTDYMMPEMNGLEMLKALRADPSLSDVPVIMLTARNTIEDRIAGFTTGADVYLGKPFSARELEAAVRQLLEKRGRHAQSVIRAHVEGLEIVSAGLAHEIHNPLTFIKNGHLLISENISKVGEILSGISAADSGRVASFDKAKQKIDRMVQSASRGIERIEQVVDLVRRYAREGFPHEPTEVKLDELVTDVTALVAPKEDVECHVILDLRCQDRTIRCIPEEMGQVVRSLVQNAVDVLPPGGTVTVRTRPEEKHVMLEVTDNGPGIPPENFAKIFSPFFTTKAGVGRGLGLAIVQIVVSRSGGSIEVNSILNTETTFRVRLPASEPSETKLPTPARPVADTPRAVSSAQS